MTAFTRTEFHTSQVLLSDKVRRYARWSSHTIFSCAIGLSLSTFIPSHISTKLINVASAIALFGVSNRLDRLAQYADGYGSISEAQSHIQYRNWLDASLQPPKREIAIAQPIEAPAPIQSTDIKKALSKPHILILGETNSGKSTLVKFLISHASAPSIVLDSHAAPDDWQGMNVIGMGRNYSAIGQEVDRLVALMNLRYELRGKGQKIFEPLIVVLDEFPACVANLGKSFAESIMLLVREARKIGIKLIVLSQGSEVKSLGIEGQGSIRECFAMVAIGKFATEKAKSLKDEGIKIMIAASQYPAMLDDFPCELPQINSFNLKNLPLPSDYLLIADSPQITQKIDTHQHSSAGLISPVTTSAAISTHQQSEPLSAALSAIIEYARKQDEFISARKVQSGIALFKSTKADEIRKYFQWLAANNHGIVRGDADNLEFSLK